MLAEPKADVEDQAILWKLEQFSALVFGRDRALVNELWSDLGFSLIGPEFGDETHTRAELAARLEEIFDLPVRLSFGWSDVKVLRERDVAWAIADCDLVLTHPDTVEYKPHRVICIFQRADGRWRWRLFSSSAMPTEDSKVEFSQAS